MPGSQQPRPRNVMFVIVDQLRADCLNGRLAGHVELPNLRALMKDAVTFDRHYTVCAPCGPARASVLTGLYPMNHRSVRNGTPLADGITNIAREVRRKGYDPLLFGYTDTSLDPRSRHPADPDLASYERTMPDFNERIEMRFDECLPWRSYLAEKGYATPPYERFYVPVSQEPGRPPKLTDPAFYRAEDSDTAFLTDKLLSELRVRRGQQWFAHAAYIRPHPPLVAPAPYNGMYRGGDLPLPSRKPAREEEAAVHPFLATLLKNTRIENFVSGFGGRLNEESDEQIQDLRAIYLGLATEVDAHLGRIVDYLKQSGEYDSTLLVFTSDHGDMLGDHFSWGKRTVYEAAFHVPLIIRDPRNAGTYGATVDAFTETVDVTPTILDWLGIPVPVAMNGASLLPFLAGRTPVDWRDSISIELDFGDPETPTAWQEEMGLTLREANLAILRENRFKLIHFNGGYPPLLFDLENDPDEMRDLAGDPEHADTVLRLTRKMLDHRMRNADHTLSDMKITPHGTVNYRGV
ncbi:MAG: alkaline phosphatase family protein [Paracoccaceae bacterium]